MAQAPGLNSLYAMVQQDENLRQKIKFLAVGQDDSAQKVMMWKAFHKVPFPLMPDPKATFGEAIKFHPYPVTMLFDQDGKIVWIHVGFFKNPEEVFKTFKSILK